MTMMREQAMGSWKPGSGPSSEQPDFKAWKRGGTLLHPLRTRIAGEQEDDQEVNTPELVLQRVNACWSPALNESDRGDEVGTGLAN